MSNMNPTTQLMDIAARIRDMRDILGYSTQKMAELTEVSEATYRQYETGKVENVDVQMLLQPRWQKQKNRIK